MSMLATLLLVAAPACQTKSEPQREPAPRREPEPVANDVTSFVGKAHRAAIGDLDGDGRNEIVLVDPERIRVVDPAGREIASVPVTRGIQALVVADIDGDARAEVIAGWGITREHMQTKVTFTIHRLQGGALVEEIIVAPETSRQDVTGIVPMPDERAVLLAYFDSKYNVTSMIAKRGAQEWETTKLASIRTATSYARGDVDGDGTPDIVVGRVYGDEQGSDGDAFVLRPNGERTPIPSTRGMRSIAIADANGDGRAEVFLGDGWHQSYAANARGLVTWARYANGQFTAELVEETADQYAIEKIVPATSGGETVLITLGNRYVRVFRRAGNAWKGDTIAGAARDISGGDLDGAPGDEVLVVGDTSEILKP